ncbi:hypothetical protein BJ878DRAFT_544623 [Calycina marina]|uniref:Uncharacterized protein n=1 Tax=Calycina marina TaxID=1763456 RepID=A0A9P7YYI8_9HELO|nr:hypothetical protein BJ878DRAFT_544623 [Calycina marina]
MNSQQANDAMKGIVDFNDSVVDTEVITKTLPAVTHENVTHHQHDAREECITREVHHYDVYHRILPVIETEFLPLRHYIKEADGRLTEIHESELSKYHILESVYTRQVVTEPYDIDPETALHNSGVMWTVPVPMLLPNLEHLSQFKYSFSTVPITTQADTTALSGPTNTVEHFQSKELQIPTKKASPHDTSSIASSPRSPNHTLRKPVASKDSASALSNGNHVPNKSVEGQTGTPAAYKDISDHKTGNGNNIVIPTLEKQKLASSRVLLSQCETTSASQTPRASSDAEGEATRGLRRMREKRNSGNSCRKSMEEGFRSMKMK